MLQTWSAVCRLENAMLVFLRLKVFICLYWGGVFLLLAGIHQTEAAGTEMSNLNWKPFIYGGMASIVAEFGKHNSCLCRLAGEPSHGLWCQMY